MTPYIKKQISNRLMAISMLCLSLHAYPQTSAPASVSLSQDMNYVMTMTPLNGVSSVSYNNGQISNYENGKVMASIQYLDGLGRAVQHVDYRFCPSGKDLVSMFEYNTLGQLYRAWNAASLSGNGAYSPLAVFSPQSMDCNNDNMPYTEHRYEASSRGRETESFGPGEDWYNNQKAVKTEFLTNSTNDATLNCLKYTVQGNSLILSGNYPTGTLSVTRLYDEDGKISLTFKDKLGRMVLERQMNGQTNHDTYYIYDGFDNLRFVLTPAMPSMSVAQSHLDTWAYQYRYDMRHRCIWKKLPGASPILYEYDQADRLVFSQDGNQRANNKWTYYLYDKLDRLTEQGECTGKNLASGKTVWLKNHYDNYDFRSQSGFNNSNFPAATVSAQGFLTGSPAARRWQ